MMMRSVGTGGHCELAHPVGSSVVKLNNNNIEYHHQHTAFAAYNFPKDFFAKNLKTEHCDITKKFSRINLDYERNDLVLPKFHGLNQPFVSFTRQFVRSHPKKDRPSWKHSRVKSRLRDLSKLTLRGGSRQRKLDWEIYSAMLIGVVFYGHPPPCMLKYCLFDKSWSQIILKPSRHATMLMLDFLYKHPSTLLCNEVMCELRRQLNNIRPGIVDRAHGPVVH